MILIPIAVTVFATLYAGYIAADCTASYGGDTVDIIVFLVALVISLAAWLIWAVLT